MTPFTRAINILASYLALPERLDPSESEESPSLFLPLVAGYIYLPVLISVDFNRQANPSTTPHNTVTLSPGLVSRSLNSMAGRNPNIAGSDFHDNRDEKILCHVWDVTTHFSTIYVNVIMQTRIPYDYLFRFSSSTHDQ